MCGCVQDYEAYVLSIGEYDERVFLGEDAPEEIGTPAKVRRRALVWDVKICKTWRNSNNVPLVLLKCRLLDKGSGSANIIMQISVVNKKNNKKLENSRKLRKIEERLYRIFIIWSIT